MIQTEEYLPLGINESGAWLAHKAQFINVALDHGYTIDQAIEMLKVRILEEIAVSLEREEEK